MDAVVWAPRPKREGAPSDARLLFSFLSPSSLLCALSHSTWLTTSNTLSLRLLSLTRSRRAASSSSEELAANRASLKRLRELDILPPREPDSSSDDDTPSIKQQRGILKNAKEALVAKRAEVAALKTRLAEALKEEDVLDHRAHRAARHLAHFYYKK